MAMYRPNSSRPGRARSRPNPKGGSRSISFLRCSLAVALNSSSTRHATASWILCGPCPRTPLAASRSSRYLICPSSAPRKAVPNSKALQEFSERHMRDEFKEGDPICFFAQDHGVIHANRVIKSLDDLRGIRLRFSARLLGDALRSVGVNAIAMPVPQVPEALAQGVIDGCVLAWEAVPTLKIQELVKFPPEIPGSPTLSTTSFLLAMNKPRYESLPGDLKAVIDANSGLKPAAEAGAIWDNEAVVVTDLVRKR